MSAQNKYPRYSFGVIDPRKACEPQTGEFWEEKRKNSERIRKACERQELMDNFKYSYLPMAIAILVLALCGSQNEGGVKTRWLPMFIPIFTGR